MKLINPQQPRRGLILLLSVILPLSLLAVEKPNILLIFADDLGYGDVSSYGATQLETPHIDRLAAEGLRLTNAYTTSAVCSQSRVSLLTGRYWWRSHLHPPLGVIAPAGPNALLETGVKPLPGFMQAQGYRTAAFGKWHVGFGYGNSPADRYDWNQAKLVGGPRDSGFDYFFGIAANVSNEPSLYIENEDFVGRGPGDQFEIDGRFVKPWSDEVVYAEDEVAGEINRNAVNYILGAPTDKPLFLYYATTIPHKPVTPAEGFIGSSNAGPYGDFVHELDAYVGDLVDALRASGRLDNTLIIFTSDNGAVVAKSESFAEKWNLHAMWKAYAAGHRSNSVLRGGKHSVYEGGNRIPFIVYWPGKVPADSEHDDLFLLTDVYATLAAVVNQAPHASALDSHNFLDLWLGKHPNAIRQSAASRTHMGIESIRMGKWKFVERDPENPTPRQGENTNQLYDLDADPGEKNNLYDQYPEVAERLRKELETIRQASASGAPTVAK
jgi:arylsulfatase A